MSSTKKYKYEGLPGFDIDPVTGKYFPVAVNFKAVFGTGKKRSQSKWSSSKKIQDAQSTQPAKYRKGETGVRKELFKIPVEKSRHVEPTGGVRKSLAKQYISKSSEPLKKLPEKKKIAPMITIAEHLETSNLSVLNNAGYVFKPPRTPQLNFSPKTEDIKTPDSSESNIDEFLKFEQLYKTPKVTNESPVSTVCNLFESKMLLGEEKVELINMSKRPITQRKIFLEIRRIVQSNQELYEDTDRKIKELIMNRQTKLEHNMKLIMTLEEKLDEMESGKTIFDGSNDESDEKENSFKRRSLRLQKKSPLDRRTSKPLGSPVILKSGDLRKSTLTKSLVHKCQKYQIESPRIQKALDMYNSARNTCSALLTPKISRGQLVDSSTGCSLRDNLSIKIQQQCLMLQDTPGHK